MLLRIGASVLALCGLLACAPLPPSLPDDSVPVTSFSPRAFTVPEEEIRLLEGATKETKNVTIDDDALKARAPLSSAESLALRPGPGDLMPTKPPALDTPSARVPESPPSASAGLVERTLPASLRRALRIGLMFGKGSLRLNGQGSMGIICDDKSMHAAGPLLAKAQGGKAILLDAKGSPLCSGKRLELSPWDGHSSLKAEGKGYRGRLEITLQAGGLQLVNIVGVEDYLKGVVPHEIGKLDASGLEALKSQAVAARTYAYRHFHSRSSQGFDLYADVRDQVYEGRDGEYALSNQAVEATRGVVMEYQGKLPDAYYHSTCAGHTESVRTWDRPELSYLSPVDDHDGQGRPYCEESRFQQWEVRLPEESLASLVARNARAAKADKIFPFQKIEQILILDRLPGGRVGKLVVVTDRGSFSVMGDRTRWLFKQGSKILPSADFAVSQGDGEWIFNGKGLGHGIGMCQMGARGRSRAGQDYSHILRHYYTGIDLVYYHD